MQPSSSHSGVTYSPRPEAYHDDYYEQLTPRQNPNASVSRYASTGEDGEVTAAHSSASLNTSTHTPKSPPLSPRTRQQRIDEAIAALNESNNHSTVAANHSYAPRIAEHKLQLLQTNKYRTTAASSLEQQNIEQDNLHRQHRQQRDLEDAERELQIFTKEFIGNDGEWSANKRHKPIGKSFVRASGSSSSTKPADVAAVNRASLQRAFGPADDSSSDDDTRAPAKQPTSTPTHRHFIPSKLAPTTIHNQTHVLDDSDAIDAKTFAAQQLRSKQPHSNKSANANTSANSLSQMEQFRLELQHKHEVVGDVPTTSQHDVATIDKLLRNHQPKPSQLSNDEWSTNVHILNLSPSAVEDELMYTFAQYGAIASVKIFWPLTLAEQAAGRNTAFVAFMQRSTAERARAELNGRYIRELPIKIDGYSKPVTLPATPLFEQIDVLNDVIQSEAAGTVIVVRPPTDAHQRKLIDRTAQHIAQVIQEDEKHALGVERCIMQHDQQSADKRYAFAYDQQHADHVYYTWRLYSLVQGDTLDNWRTAPYQLLTDSPLWLPPPMTSATAEADDSRAAKPNGKAATTEAIRTSLTEAEEDHFLNLLRGVTLERSSIAQCMVYALQHSDQSVDITEILVESLTLDETALTSKLARLYVLIDILSNISSDAGVQVRNATSYRAQIEAQMPAVIKSFAYLLQQQPGRMSQLQLKDKVHAVFDQMQRIGIYERETIQRWVQLFEWK